MGRNAPLFITALVLLAFCAASGKQADREYVDKENGFKLTLAGEWKPSSYTDAIGRQRTEFVWAARQRGLLRIARQNKRGRSLADFVRNEVEALRLGSPCVFTGQQAFSGGSLNGIRLSLYYFEGSRAMTGISYFLEDNDAVWFLRFTGEVGSAALAGEIPDRMARSFCSVSAL